MGWWCCLLLFFDVFVLKKHVIYGILSRKGLLLLLFVVFWVFFCVFLNGVEGLFSEVVVVFLF